MTPDARVGVAAEHQRAQRSSHALGHVLSLRVEGLPLYELPLGPHTEHMAKGVAAALRSLMRSCADPDGWLPILLDEQR